MPVQELKLTLLVILIASSPSNLALHGSLTTWPDEQAPSAEHVSIAAGACIVVVPPSLMHRPKQLGTYLLQAGVTHMTSIPRTWQQLCDAWLPGETSPSLLL